MGDFWQGAKGVLSTVAPMLATAVGGPLAGAATGAIINALGLAPDTPPEQVAAAVTGATPEQLLALKKADADFRVQMRQLDIDEQKLSFNDVADARKQTVSLAQSGSRVAWGAPSVSLVVTLMFGAVLYMTMTQPIPPGQQEAANILLGMLGTAFGAVVQYWVGSSFGSDRKSDLLFASHPAPKG